MSWETILPETVKAASAPATKLIEVCAAGCGALFEPHQIRRRAKADADALIVLETGKAKASEIRLRAAHRLLQLEEHRQSNIEAIAREAAGLLPSDVSAEPVDPDWATRFFGDCKDISNEKMRTVWAKLLAGEVTRPGSFSMRTLAVLRNLSRREAELFHVLCRRSFRGVTLHDIYPFVSPMMEPESYWNEVGLTWAAFERLADAGLIVHHSAPLYLDLQAPFVIRTSPVQAFEVTRGQHAVRIALGRVSLTKAGLELAQLGEWDSEGRVEAFLAGHRSGYQLREVDAPAPVSDPESLGSVQRLDPP